MSTQNVATTTGKSKTYADIQHAGKRLEAAMSELECRRRVREVLKGRKLKDVPESEHPAILTGLRLSLASYLAETFGPIFPINAELKDPWCTNGHLDATTDHKQLELWVRAKPNCNWGGCINSVVDVDTSEAHGKDGLGNWRKLLAENNNGNEPGTLRLKTPTGGLHYPLTAKYPKRDLLPGVELPNYVVLPGSHVTANGKSVKATGFYKPDNDLSISGVPFVGKLIGEKTVETPTANDNNAPAVELDLPANIERAIYFLKNDAKPSIQGNGGEKALFDTAALLKDLGISYETAVELINEHYNVERKCEPLWSFREGADADRLEKKISNAYNYATQTQPGALGIGAESDFKDDPVEEGDFRVDPEIEESGTRRNRLKGRSFAELDALPEPIFVVANMVPDNGLTVLYGKPKRGKSFWALDLSLCMATDTPFFGEKLGRNGPVIYVAAEGGAAAIRNRVRSWLKARKVDPAKLEGKWLLVDTAVLLNSRSSVQNFLALNPGDYAMVFIDTLARCMNGDENSAKDMSSAIKGADYIREQVKGGVLIVHHEGWSQKRVRGSSVLQGAPDAVIRVARDSGNVTTVIAEDMRESAAGRRQDFILSNGVLSILSPEDMAARATGDKAIDILATLQSENGGDPVKDDVWRKMVEAAGLIDADKSKSTGRSQWKRLVEKAVSSRRVKRHKGDLYSVNVGRDDLNDDAAMDFNEDPE